MAKIPGKGQYPPTCQRKWDGVQNYNLEMQFR